MSSWDDCFDSLSILVVFELDFVLQEYHLSVGKKGRKWEVQGTLKHETLVVAILFRHLRHLDDLQRRSHEIRSNRHRRFEGPFLLAATQPSARLLYQNMYTMREDSARHRGDGWHMVDVRLAAP